MTTENDLVRFRAWLGSVKSESVDCRMRCFANTLFRASRSTSGLTASPGDHFHVRNWTRCAADRCSLLHRITQRLGARKKTISDEGENGPGPPDGISLVICKLVVNWILRPWSGYLWLRRITSEILLVAEAEHIKQTASDLWNMSLGSGFGR